MKTTKVCLIAIVIAVVPAFANAPDDEAVIALFYEIGEAQRTGQFQSLAQRIHPQSLAPFKRSVLIDIDKLAEMYSDPEVEALLGVTREELVLFSDPEFYIFICSLAWDLFPGLGEDYQDKEFVILGIVPDGVLHHALFRFRVTRESDSDRIRLQRPRLLTLLRSDDKWMIYSMLFANRIEPIFRRELLRNRERAALEEGAGGNAD